ncbi:M18 family aminopeptidase [Nitrincola sp. MINF-07-Sa-05]|uniref:M18 family aminopeptidase n=1 Tax=Nitrincola salilacus TaxID=3400273 RepID=UPI003917BF94
MHKDQFNQALISFLNASPTPFHAVATMSELLRNAGFEELAEDTLWNTCPGGAYFTLKNGSSILAWREPTAAFGVEAGWRMVGAHTDSPCLKVKPQPEIHRKGYLQLGVEVYGGVLLNPWFDRDLSMAGRVSYRALDGTLKSGLVDFTDAVAYIPSLAIHLDREANNTRSINAQTYLPPILGQADSKQDFRNLLKGRLLHEGYDDVADVLDFEISLYDCQGASMIGLNREFLASARLDNLLSCFIGLQALIDSPAGPGQVLICNDHEEVGSVSACGAQGPMLTQWLQRVTPQQANAYQVQARSLMISADNAHGIHPNFADRHDDNHGPLLNGGPVIKINANQRYASNSETSARFRDMAQQEQIPVQSFVVRTDMGCGSTIGPLTAAETGIRTVDIGIPQFAMHSIRELVGADDPHRLYRVLKRFNETEQV